MFHRSLQQVINNKSHPINIIETLESMLDFSPMRRDSFDVLLKKYFKVDELAFKVETNLGPKYN